jgi:arylsulfatase
MAGSVALEVDGVDAGSAELPLLMRVISSVGSSIGFDHGSPVSARYGGPFPFSGELHEVEIALVSKHTGDAGEAEARAGMARQ